MGSWWLEAIGWIGSAVLVWSLLQTQLRRLRIINLVGCFILIGYNAVNHVWPMVGLNVVLAAINIYYLAQMSRERHDAGAYEVLECVERAARLRAALERIPPNRRAVVILHDLEGLPLGEVAEIVGANLLTVRSRLRDGRKVLLRELEADPYFGAPLDPSKIQEAT